MTVEDITCLLRKLGLVVTRKAADEIDRLRHRVDVLDKECTRFMLEAADAHAEIFKAQGEPVAVHQWKKRSDYRWIDAPKEEAYSRVDEYYEARTLYTSAPSSTKGEVVVTWDAAQTRILAVTRQDEEGRVLSVIAESGTHEGWQLVPVEPSPEMEAAREKAVYDGNSEWDYMLTAAPKYGEQA